MTSWKTIPNLTYPADALPTLEHAEFGRSTADLFPCREPAGKWEYVIDGQWIGFADSHEEAASEAEISAWDSAANTLYARGTPHH